VKGEVGEAGKSVKWGKANKKFLVTFSKSAKKIITLMGTAKVFDFQSQIFKFAIYSFC
jgi:hypothetical protein